jgi:hypothetical protein
VALERGGERSVSKVGDEYRAVAKHPYCIRSVMWKAPESKTHTT